MPLDVALLQISPPDRHGFCRLGTSSACARAAADHARTVIALVNSRVPRTLGNSAVHVSRIPALVEADRPLPALAPARIGDIEAMIGAHVAAFTDGRTPISLCPSGRAPAQRCAACRNLAPGVSRIEGGR